MNSQEEWYGAVRARAAELADRLYSRTWSADERDDLVQEVMIKFHGRWAETSGPDSVDAWLTTVIRRTAINAADERRRRQAREAPGSAGHDDAVDSLITSMTSPVFTSDQAIREDLMATILALLGERDRDLVRLRYIWKQPAAEVGSQLDMTPNAVDQAARRAIKRLRDALQERRDLIDALQRAHPRVYRTVRQRPL